MITIKTLLCLFVILSLKCGPPSVAGGTGTGSNLGEGKLIGSVKLPTGNPAANTTVILRNYDYIPFSISSQLQSKTISDNSGKFTFDSIQKGHYLLEMQNSDSLSIIERVKIATDNDSITLDSVILKKQTSFSGVVSSEIHPVSGSKFIILGLDREGIIKDDGSFSFTLPYGRHLFRLVYPNNDTSSYLFIDDKDCIDTLKVSKKTSTVLDNFNTINSYINLHTILGGGNWFAYTDEIEGGGSRIDPAIEEGMEEAFRFDEEIVYSGGYLHLNMLVDTSRISPYAVLGFNLCDAYNSINDTGNVWFDFTKMNALTFIAMGSGTIIVQFTSKYIDSNNNELICYFRVPVELTSSWKKYSIQPSDIPSATKPNSKAGESISWDTSCSNISSIGFSATKNVELFLDDIIVEGMDLTDFLQ